MPGGYGRDVFLALYGFPERYLQGVSTDVSRMLLPAIHDPEPKKAAHLLVIVVALRRSGFH